MQFDTFQTLIELNDFMPYIDFQKLVVLEAEIAADFMIDWQSAGNSHAGRIRKVNEDAFYHSADQGLWVVADGMGGLARGDYASSVVVEACAHFCKSNSLAASIRDLETRLRAAHDSCRESFKVEKGDPVGSTVAVLFSYGQYIFFLWAGDSRIYRLRGDQLKQNTVDHTVAQERFARGELSPEQVAHHPSAHILTRAVGVHQTLHLELDYQTVEPGDRFLVCSDGIYNELSPANIHQLLSLESAAEAVNALVEKALDNGGRDNITAIVVDATCLTS
jgi:serine/threonine protein phosphatase PrpC